MLVEAGLSGSLLALQAVNLAEEYLKPWISISYVSRSLGQHMVKVKRV
tara:strand:+ start:784 stop:927 length:144 start_codon:yes stop_codon:yes gene_type:complete